MTRIKICGIREEAHALAAAEAGADFIGLVFAHSRRRVTPAQAEEIASAVKKSGHATEVVGVFVNAPTPMAEKIAGSCHLDWVQLSGDEPWQCCAVLNMPVIKAIRMDENQRPQKVLSNLATGEKVLSTKKHIYLLDSQVKGKYGGSGKIFDWNLAQPVAAEYPVIIAGGLAPGNVGEAIKMVKPWGVDVSSGVETGGIKDIAKIRAFIEAVRKADEG